MADSIICIEGVGKKYLIPHEGQVRHNTLRDQLMHGLRNIYKSRSPGNLSGERGQRSTEEFWALKDLDFEIKPGERVGIIGKNGAGKSTLLKVLSRITEPSTGRITIRGRISSLLEVGTGFHPELSGRENIFLNGAILGMSRQEIRQKFDEIVEFSGVEQFLDTPVKRYSSGMYVRLAFAIAAHLEPEILIVDEVLAVGDAEFQEKCIGKMDEVSKGGRTILFVSHQMGLIAQLCNRALFLQKGTLKYDGGVKEAIELYNKRGGQGLVYRKENSTKDIYFQKIKIHNASGEACAQFGHDESIYITLQAFAKTAASSVQATIALLDHWQRRLFTIHIPFAKFRRDGEFYTITIKLQEGLIVPDTYNFHFDLFIPFQAEFDVVSGSFPVRVQDNGSEYASYEGAGYGYYFINYQVVS